MGQLPVAMPKTISAVDHLRRSGPAGTRGQAGDLLLALASVECHASAGGPARVPPALLRDLVLITARLAGQTRLKGNADSTVLFAALHATRQPPPLLSELDRILAGVLSDRFGLLPPATAA